MAIYADKEALKERQEEMRWRQERKKEREKLAKKKVFSPLKSNSSGKKD